MPDNQFKIGNVSFNKNEVSSYSVKKLNEENENGPGTHAVEKYCVILKDGTEVQYPSQNNSHASVFMSQDGTVNFMALNKAKIIDTEKDDKYNLEGCKYTQIFANRGNDKDIIKSSDLFLMGEAPIKQLFNCAHINQNDIVNNKLMPYSGDYLFRQNEK